MRRNDKNNKNKINTSTTDTNSIFLLQHNNNKNNYLESNKEPRNIDCTKITTEYIKSKTNSKNIIIKNNSSSNNNTNDKISISRNSNKKEQKKTNSKPKEDKQYSGTRVTNNNTTYHIPTINKKKEPNQMPFNRN